MNISFAGCGFLGIYHVGVASCFREHAPHLIDKIAGASAGAVLGTLLVCDGIDLGKILEDVLKTAAKARARSLGPFHPGFNIQSFLEEGLRSILPEDIHLRASGRMFISLTRLVDRKNVIVSEFRSKDDLIDALMCTAFIPFYSGFLPPTFRGTRYVDGGISDNLPIIDKTKKTITVSPLSGTADICPQSHEFSDYINITLSNTNIQLTASNLYRMCRALYPPEPSVLSRMCKQGFEDALHYLKTHTLIPCERHVLIHRSKSVCLGDPALSCLEPQSSRTSLASKRMSLRPCKSQSVLEMSPPTLQMPSTSGEDGRWYLSEEDEEEKEEEREEMAAHEEDQCLASEDESDCLEDLDQDVFREEADDLESLEEGRMWEDWDDNDFFENRPCQRCEHHSNRIKLVKSLPPEVIRVLTSSCESLKPSVWNYLSGTHIGSMMSLASLPLVLPIETAYSIAIRLTRWLPHLPSDLRMFVSGLMSILRVIESNMKDMDIKKFDAEFSCHFGLELEPDTVTPAISSPTSSHHAHELLALDMATGQPRRRKLNFAFSMDVQTETLPDCIIDTFDFCDDLSELTIPRRQRVHMERNLRHESEVASTSAGAAADPGGEYDFDYTLKLSREMEDVITYHYLHISQQLDKESGRSSVEIVEL